MPAGLIPKQTFKPFNAWCPLKDHTHLNKPETESYWFA